jgi:hypothetical protein
LAQVTGLIVVIRYGLETLGAHFFPQRLAAVTHPPVPMPSITQQSASLIVKTAIFTLAAVAYLGNVWELYVGAALFVIPSVAGMLQGRFPNWQRVARYVPSGITKVLFSLFVGKLAAWALLRQLSNPSQMVTLGFVWLAIPGLILSFLSFFARDPDKKLRVNWAWRGVGACELAFGVALVLGIIVLPF